MQWLPVKNFENLYEVSNTGLVRSIDRVLIVKGQWNRFVKGKLLYQNTNKQVCYKQVNLWKNNQGKFLYVHRLVAEAFINNPENKPEVNHIDGNKHNNCVENLEWVTSSENSYHASETGLRIYTNRLTEEEFLECLYDVINGESYQSLSQRIPYKVPFISTKIRKLAKKYELENELNESLAIQRSNRVRINGNPHLRNTN